MIKLRTTEDILNDRTMLTEDEANTIRANVAKNVTKIKAGRKPAIVGNSRNRVIKVSDDTKEAVNYAYSIGIAINLEDVKLLQYIKEHGLTLANLKQV